MRDPKIVGVIFSRADLRRALRMRKPPDFFELRLDRLIFCLDEVRRVITRLPAPLIITARDPREGGAHKLQPLRRRALLLEFLSRARYVDVELQSARPLRPVLELATQKKIGIIVSFHDLRSTPSPSRLSEIALCARSLGAAIVKVATRTDTREQLGRLIEFFAKKSFLPVAAMGIGRLGRAVRRELITRGSILNYVYLGRSRVAGQPSLSEVRRWMLTREASEGGPTSLLSGEAH